MPRKLAKQLVLNENILFMETVSSTLKNFGRNWRVKIPGEYGGKLGKRSFVSNFVSVPTVFKGIAISSGKPTKKFLEQIIPSLPMKDFALFRGAKKLDSWIYCGNIIYERTRRGGVYFHNGNITGKNYKTKILNSVEIILGLKDPENKSSLSVHRGPIGFGKGYFFKSSGHSYIVVQSPYFGKGDQVLCVVPYNNSDKIMKVISVDKVYLKNASKTFGVSEKRMEALCKNAYTEILNFIG